MKISSFDPSSSGIGYACLDDGEFVAFDLIKPRGIGDKWWQRWSSMEGAVQRVLNRDRPDVMVIEDIPGIEFGGRPQRRGSLQSYACVVGGVFTMCRLFARKWELDPRQVVVMVTPQEWINRASKEHRKMLAIEGFAKYGYRSRDDPGYDVADALCLGTWYWNQQK